MDLFNDRKILMCSPLFYDIKYEINPWMDTNNKVEGQTALLQWQKLHHTIIRLGFYVEYNPPQKEFPDMVFTANAGLVKGNTVVLSNFRFPERQGETHCFRGRFRAMDYEIFELPKNIHFEGNGDALFADEHTLFAGYGFRSDKEAYYRISDILRVDKVVFCELIDERFYHLDTCFCPISKEHALIYENAFSSDSLKRIKDSINVIPIPEDESNSFACNSVVLDNHILMPAGCFNTRKTLERMGFSVHEIDVSEFIKSGGACKCLTLDL